MQFAVGRVFFVVVKEGRHGVVKMIRVVKRDAQPCLSPQAARSRKHQDCEQRQKGTARGHRWLAVKGLRTIRATPTASETAGRCAFRMRGGVIRAAHKGFCGRKSRGEQPRYRAISLICEKLYLVLYFGLSAWLIIPFDTPIPVASMACDIFWALLSFRTASMTYWSIGVITRLSFSLVKLKIVPL